MDPVDMVAADVDMQAKDAFEKLGASVVGLSHNDSAAHQDFCSKHALAVELIADPEATLLTALGVPQLEWKGSLYGERTTLLVDPEGKIRKVYPKVDPAGHEAAVLEDLKLLQRQSAGA